MLLSSNQNTQLPQNYHVPPNAFFWGSKFLRYGDHKNEGVNSIMDLFGNLYIFCKICKTFKEKQSKVVTLRGSSQADPQNEVGFSQSFTLTSRPI
jgi:hypothetical protein